MPLLRHSDPRRGIGRPRRLAAPRFPFVRRKSPRIGGNSRFVGTFDITSTKPSCGKASTYFNGGTIRGSQPNHKCFSGPTLLRTRYLKRFIRSVGVFEEMRVGRLMQIEEAK